MLQVHNLTKRYAIANFKQTALDQVSLSFRDKEFVCILGPSGSGKTTLLNMIGGLDRYDEGDLLIDGKSTQHFSDKDWDSYRNHAIGFIFQSYNLINHTSVLANVEIGMTLSGLSPEKRRQRALEVLEQVGLKDHVYKKPNQLSGGQMQRVAIARALANDPEIILADEPTGAIDSETSAQIMGLIQEIAKDKLVIMVTHDQTIAERYASRIVSLKDGQVIDDTRPYEREAQKQASLSFKKTSMAFVQALKLSFNNLKTKKFRTLITAFAGSIGIIGVALVLALANGLNEEILQLERSTLAEFPLQIDPLPINIEAARSGPPRPQFAETEREAFPESFFVFPFERQVAQTQHVNIIRDEFINHLDDLDPELYNQITTVRSVNMNVLTQQDNGSIIEVDTRRVGFGPTLNDEEFFEDNYDLLMGRAPTNENEMLLVVDTFNQLNVNVLSALGFSTSVESIAFEQFLDREFRIVFPEDYFRFDEDLNRFFPVGNTELLFNHENALPVTIVGIARAQEGAASTLLASGIKYHPSLETRYLDEASTSLIGELQAQSDVSMITGLPLSESARTNLLRSLGVDRTPSQIRIYPVSFEAKTQIRDHLDAFNENLSDPERIIYTDLAALITELTGDVITGISLVLIAFSAISLVVSSIMIGIITYVSVLERTKEIGILRSLGARKKDISRVFNAETSIIGFVAGALGVTIAFFLTFPINRIINSRVEQLDRLAVLPIWAFIALIGISIFLTYVSGLIPAGIAARKNPVEALRMD